ncbi:hypothetical protein ACFYXV_29165 [Streptomyces sp. NPDC002181]|uniref:hypothetical protein n=1 Tax=Streptomyces sp. NPDC002181 TaxID=3364635 RepID=UPI00369DB98D
MLSWQDAPSSLEAGGDWWQAGLVVDNTNGVVKSDDPYKLSLRFFPTAPEPEDHQV